MKSLAQWRALIRPPVVHEGSRDARREGGIVVYVAGVGGGKTVALALPVYAQPDGMTVVIQPLRSLLYSTTQKLLEWNIKAVLWEGAEPDGEYTVVLISPEGMNTRSWDRFINVKRAKFRIDRAVLDEAQEVLVFKEFRRPLETRSTISPVILERPILTWVSPGYSEVDRFSHPVMDSGLLCCHVDSMLSEVMLVLSGTDGYGL